MGYQNIQTVEFKKGETIFNEGEKSDDIYIIKKGKVDLLKKNSSGKNFVLENLSDGDVFGELGIVLGRIRQYTVKAKTDIIVEVVNPRFFSKLFDTDANTYISPIVQAYAKRIREYETRLEELGADQEEEEIPETSEEVTRGSKVLFEAVSKRALISLHGGEKIEITKFPFRVGRYSRRRSDMLFHKNDLYLHDKYPFNVSRSHFAILLKKDGYYFQDFGSWHGSELNGNKMINPGKKNNVLLNKGENTLRIGNKEADLLYKIYIP